MQSCQSIESQEILQGRWMKDQHDRFLAGIMEHGKDWKIVEKVVKTRTGPQVRSHAQKFFIKLNKINKQRKKAKNFELIQPSDIQREILNQFTQKDLTSNTPIEISNIIKKDWNTVRTHYKQKNKQIQNNKQFFIKESIIENQNKIQNENQIEQKYKEEVRNYIQEDQDQSYFIKIIKMNKQHFISGHDFNELIDFQPNNPNFTEQSLTNIARPGKRKRSFSLPDQEQNQTKLKQTLNNLHRKLGYQP